jgi:DNA modification methylase
MVSSLPDDAVDVTVTSPPYGAMKDYGVESQIGFGQPYEDYLDSLSKIFEPLLAKTKGTGSLWLVADSFKDKSKLRLFPFDIATRLVGIGWQLQDVIVWNKTKTLPWSRPGQFRRVFEYVFFFTKTSSFKYFINRVKEPDDLKEWWVSYPERYSPEGRVPTTIWTYPIPVQGSWSKNGYRHFCPFPYELVERIILLTTDRGDCVLDPFAGSGVVLAQAKAMGRKFMGCDVKKSYQEQFHKVMTNHIGEMWQSSKVVLAKAEEKQHELASTIRKLRQVKFPKALFNRVRRKLGGAEAGGVRSILAITSPVIDQRSSHYFSTVSVNLLCDRASPMPLIERTARELIKKPPLSKYGILPEVHCEFWDDFVASEGWLRLKGQRLFLYLEGNTHFCKHEVAAPQWFTSSPGSWKVVPPLLINVEVRQPRVRTWVPKEPQT